MRFSSVAIPLELKVSATVTLADATGKVLDEVSITASASK